MKLDNLLGPYLYQHKKLNLPGIGTFEADMSTVVPEDNDKHHTLVQGITFKQHSSPEPDIELIDYIKAHTGKMRPLAMADLESYLMLVKQFLNIGKPFYIEGIGTLQKVSDGTFKFTPGQYISPRLENSTQGSPTGSTKRTASESKNTDPNTGRSTARKAMLTLATIATIAVIGWGGYYFYKININEREEVLPADTLITPLPDTANTIIIQPDSSILAKDTAATKADTSGTAKVKKDTAKAISKPLRTKRIKPVKIDSIPAIDSSSTAN